MPPATPQLSPSSSGARDPDWSSQGLLYQTMFKSVCENLLRDPNANAADDVGFPGHCDYSGAFLDSPNEELKMPHWFIETFAYSRVYNPYTPELRDMFGGYNELLTFK
jgi:hypothetical protein